MLIVELRIIGIRTGNLHLVLKSPILSTSWKLCKELMKRPASVTILMRCLSRIVSLQHFRNVPRAAQRPMSTWRKFWYFLNFLSIYMSLNSRCISVWSFVKYFYFTFLASVDAFANDLTIKSHLFLVGSWLLLVSNILGCIAPCIRATRYNVGILNCCFQKF